jgi:predicted metal-binding membrane protein
VTLRRPIWIATALLGATLVAWVVTIDRMRGMDAGPGTDLRALGWYVGVWVTMMAAMMLPSVAPMVLVFARIVRERSRRDQDVFVPTWVFVAGYLAVWTAYGLAAYGIYRGLRNVAPAFVAWNRDGPYVAGGALAFAGLYELTPLKNVCLRHCRGPLHFVMHRWKSGRLGAVRMGVEHGAYCVGCCWGLMVALFALGVMSVTWMVVVGLVILGEKVLPRGEWVARVVAVAAVGLGIWVAAAPSSVPGLTQPGSSPTMQSMR